MQWPDYSCQFTCEKKIRTNQLHKRRCHVWRVAGPHQVLASFIFMLGTTIKLSMLFKFWGHSGVHKKLYSS